MTNREKLYFDTDGISAFLWVGKTSIIAELYPGRIVIPKAVYDELNHPRVPHLKQRIDQLKDDGNAVIEDIDVGSEAYDLYHKMTTDPDEGMVVVGPGEAAAMALSKTKNGILVSNNLRDINQYIEKWGLENKTTGCILKEALDAGIITKEDGESIWAEMLARKRKLGYTSFQEYLEDSLH